MPMYGDTQYSDVLNDVYKTGTLTVGTTAVELKVDASAASKRETVIVYNDSNTTVYFGPSTVTTSNGQPLKKNQRMIMNISENLPIYFIAESADNTIRIQEIG